MTPPSELVWRNRQRLEPGEPLTLLAAPGDALPLHLGDHGCPPRLLPLSSAAHADFLARGLNSELEFPPHTQSPSHIVLFQPREKALLDMLLDLCASWLDETGRLWLVGENRAGIRSAAKRLADHFECETKLDSARHCALFEARQPRSGDPFTLGAHFESWAFELAGQTYEIHDLPGVFARGRLDAGTLQLLGALVNHGDDLDIRGRVLDFGCGSGAIGATLASFYPGIELTLLDDSILAVTSAARTLKANSISGRVLPSDGFEGLKDAGESPFDWIVSNPPFHSGVRQDLSTTRLFLEQCHQWLHPGGRLCLVANAHLPYRQWLQELFGDVQVLAADGDYNTWLVRG